MVEAQIVAQSDAERSLLHAAKDRFISCIECDGEGGFSDWSSRGPDCRETTCTACGGTGEHAGRKEEWTAALALWNATPGDVDTRWDVVATRFPDWDVAEDLGTLADELAGMRSAPGLPTGGRDADA